MKAVKDLTPKSEFVRDNLPALLYYLHDKKFNGELKIHFENDVIRLFWYWGNVYKIWQTNTPEPLGRVLFELGYIDMDVYNQSLIEMSKTGLRQGEVLLRANQITKEQLNKGLQIQLARKLNRIFFIARATYEAIEETQGKEKIKEEEKPILVPMLTVIYNGMKNTLDERRALRLLGGDSIEFEISADFDAFASALPLEEDELVAFSTMRSRIGYKNAVAQSRLSSAQIAIILNYLELLDLVKIYVPQKQAKVIATESVTKKQEAVFTNKLEAKLVEAATKVSESTPIAKAENAQVKESPISGAASGQDKPEAQGRQITGSSTLPDPTQPKEKKQVAAQQGNVATNNNGGQKADAVAPAEEEKKTERPTTGKRISTGKYVVTDKRESTGKFAIPMPLDDDNDDLMSENDIVDFLNHLNEMDYYQMFGVVKSADAKTIHDKYFEVAKQYHPDKYRSGKPHIVPTCEEITAQLNKAFTTLSDEQLRKEYDDNLRTQMRSRPTTDQINRARVCFEAGRELLASQDLYGAEGQFKKAVEIEPGSTHYTLLGVTQFALATQAGEGAEYLVKAEENLFKAIKLNINNIDAHYNISLVCERLEQMDRALAHAERAMNLAPNRSDLKEHFEFLKKLKAEKEHLAKLRDARIPNGSEKEGDKKGGGLFKLFSRKKEE